MHNMHFNCEWSSWQYAICRTIRSIQAWVVFTIEARLCNLSLLPSRGSAKLVESDVKPVIDVCVDFVVLVTDLLRGQPFLQSLHTPAYCLIYLSRFFCPFVVGLGASNAWEIHGNVH